MGGLYKHRRLQGTGLGGRGALTWDCTNTVDCRGAGVKGGKGRSRGGIVQTPSTAGDRVSGEGGAHVGLHKHRRLQCVRGEEA